MERVLSYIGECAGVEPGDVDGLIAWADTRRAAPPAVPEGLVRLVIERSVAPSPWEAYAYPHNNLDEALELLADLREKERTKRYRAKLRLVRITRQVIAAAQPEEGK